MFQLWVILDTVTKGRRRDEKAGLLEYSPDGLAVNEHERVPCPPPSLSGTPGSLRRKGYRYAR